MGVALGRAQALDGADPVDPGRAAQRRAAAGRVRRRAERRWPVAVAPAGVLEGDAAQPIGRLDGDGRGGAGAHRVADQRRAIELETLDGGQDVRGGALAETVLDATRLAVAGRVEHGQVVVRAQVLGQPKPGQTAVAEAVQEDDRPPAAGAHPVAVDADAGDGEVALGVAGHWPYSSSCLAASTVSPTSCPNVSSRVWPSGSAIEAQ